MRTSLRIKLLALFVLLFSCLVPASALAIDVLSPVCNDKTDTSGNVTYTAPKSSAACVDGQNSTNKNPIYGPNGILTRAIFILSLVVAVVSIIIIVIAGIKMSVSQGEPQKITIARNQIIYAIVGIVVASLAQAIVTLVLKRLPT